jgi:hypothetical protein
MNTQDIIMTRLAMQSAQRLPSRRTRVRTTHCFDSSPDKCFMFVTLKLLEQESVQEIRI